MDKKMYANIIKKHKPKEDVLKNSFIAFIVGGLMGMLGEFLIEVYSYYLNIPSKDATTYMLITLIFISCLLTCLGFYDKVVTFCKAGLIIPITGFAHSMMSAALDYRKEGMINGLGANMFKLAGSVIVCGVVSSYIFGLIRLLLFGGNI